MRWILFALVGFILLAFGITLIAYAENIPVYYAGGGTGVSMTGKVVGGLAPGKCEIPITTLPNTMRIRARSIEPVEVTIRAPNGTLVAQWQNETVNEDYQPSLCGYWNVTVYQPSRYFVYGEVVVNAPLYAHPAFMYASIPVLLGSMSLFHSNYKRKQASRFKDIQFEQNIGGRWVFLAWIPILIIVSQAPFFIPSFQWLYLILLAITVTAVFFSFALAYVKISVSKENFIVEVPFLNFHRNYRADQIFGYQVEQVDKQRLLGFWSLPTTKREDQVTVTLLEPLPMRIWITSLATRLNARQIVLRPKSTQKFTDAAASAGLLRKDESNV